MSGFTTTGLSVIPNLASLPKSLLIWRAMTQWIGGIGIVVLFLTVLVGPGMSASFLFKGEAREERLAPSTRHTARGMVQVYAFYTFVGTSVLVLLGLPVFDAIAHVFTSISTGGFSINAAGVAAYSNPLVEIAFLVLMVVGSTSFVLHYKLLGFRWKEIKSYVKSLEFRFFFMFMALFAVVLTLYFYFTGDASPLRHGVFQVISSSTTTGYTNMSIIGTSDFVKIILIVLMFVGGSAGSTAGGLKIIRFLILLESIPWVVNKYLLPNRAIFPLKFGKRRFTNDQVIQVTTYLFIYIMCIIVGALIITALGYPFLDSLFETTSGAATVGLSTGITSYSLHIIGKIVLIFEMWIGRLEILPILVWIGASLGSKKWSHFYK
jgi:trk system potassium uptake protein TrkH